MSLAKFNKGSKFTVDTTGFEFKKLSEVGEGEEVQVRGFFFTEGNYGRQPILISDGVLYNLPGYMEQQICDIIADDEAVASINAGNESAVVRLYHNEKFNKDSWTVDFI